MSKHYTKAALIGLGLTQGGIDRFFPEPDEYAPNPKYKCAAPMKLYSIARVRAALASPEYVEWAEGSARRKISAQAGVATRKAKLMAMIEDWTPAVRVLPYPQVETEAIASYNDWQSALESERVRSQERSRATATSDEKFLKRITLNYVRHELTDYERKLGELYGRPGCEDAYERGREILSGAILAHYPQLVEADREQHERLIERREVADTNRYSAGGRY